MTLTPQTAAVSTSPWAGWGAIVAVNDYYPFGSMMPGRNYNAGNYRFGFNSHESDPEISGSWGTHYTAEFWMYDARVNRRWNVDPVVYPWQSGYSTFNNNPIYFIDPYGLVGQEAMDGSGTHDDPFVMPEVIITPKRSADKGLSHVSSFLGGIGTSIISGLHAADNWLLGTHTYQQKDGYHFYGSVGGNFENAKASPHSYIMMIDVDMLLTVIGGAKAAQFQFRQGPFAVAEGMAKTSELIQEIVPKHNTVISVSTNTDVKNQIQKTASKAHNNKDLWEFIESTHISGNMFDSTGVQRHKVTYKDGTVKLLYFYLDKKTDVVNIKEIK